jgi:phosphatidylserine decarboxylase
MVRDGFYYAGALLAVAVIIGWVATPALAIIPLLLAAFFLWFFRDPDRVIPQAAGAVVSPADGKVTEVSPVAVAGEQWLRISVFLNVFNVHVNRSPVSGVITGVEYRRGKFHNAMGATSAEINEQSICHLRGDDGHPIVFKQIAGLLARRIVFNRRTGERVERGERVGLIKFGSRCDVLLPAAARPAVKVGENVKGGSTILAVLPEPAPQRILDAHEQQSGSSR